MTRQGYSKADAAWQFHAGLADTIMIIANRYGFKKLAFSGGVFQNGVLVDLICDRSNNSWDLYFHNELSPNDENISFGQLIYAMQGIESGKVSAKQSVVY
jgi:hydrogenase maturation protein HypF